MIKFKMIGKDHKGNNIYIAHKMLQQLLTAKKQYDFEARHLDKYAVAHIIQNNSEFYLLDTSENLYLTIIGYLEDAAVKTRETINNFSIIGENIIIAITFFYSCNIEKFDINKFINNYGERLNLEEIENLYDAVTMSGDEEFKEENKQDEQDFGYRLYPLYWYLFNDGENLAEQRYYKNLKRILHNN